MILAKHFFLHLNSKMFFDKFKFIDYFNSLYELDWANLFEVWKIACIYFGIIEVGAFVVL